MSYEYSKAIVLTAAVMCIIISASCAENLSDNQIDPNPAASSDSAPLEPAVDDEGRWIVRLGIAELRIPKQMRSRPPAASPYNHYQADLCLDPSRQLSDPSCYELKDRIRVFLMAPSATSPMPKCNVGRDFGGELHTGPHATANPQVDLYQSEGSLSRRYVLREPGEKCRNPTARCNQLRCLSLFMARSDVVVRYEFVEDAIGNWPSIHRRILNHANSLIAEE